MVVDFINYKHKYLSKHAATIMPAVTAYTALWKRAISRTQFSLLILSPSIFPIARHSILVTLTLPPSLSSALFIRASIFFLLPRFFCPVLFLPAAKMPSGTETADCTVLGKKIPRNFRTRSPRQCRRFVARRRTHRGKIDSNLYKNVRWETSTA